MIGERGHYSSRGNQQDILAPSDCELLPRAFESDPVLS
jgi:hypothetical protein